MAPLSRLLVYYVRPSGEGVADAIVFQAQPDFRNKVTISNESGFKTTTMLSGGHFENSLKDKMTL